MKFQGSYLNPCLILKGKQKAICTSSNRLILSAVCCVVCVCVCVCVCVNIIFGAHVHH